MCKQIGMKRERKSDKLMIQGTYALRTEPVFEWFAKLVSATHKVKKAN